MKALTPSAVGAAAGYSSAIVTGRFGDRATLLDALDQGPAGPVRAARVGPARASRGCSTVVDAYLRERTPQLTAFVTLWAEALAGEPDLQSSFAARDARFRATLVGYLRDGIADGTIRARRRSRGARVVARRPVARGELRSDEAARSELVTLLERGLRAG